MEERKEGDWLSCRMHETYHTGLSKILIHNEPSAALLGAYVYIPSYIRDDTHYCYRSVNSLSHTSLHSHYSNTVNISTVVMLGFCLCQFNTGSLACGLFVINNEVFLLVVAI